MYIAKVRFDVYLFTFIVAIYSSSRHIKVTFATEGNFDVSRNFENGLTVNYRYVRS